MYIGRHDVVVDVDGKGHAMLAIEHLYNRTVILHPVLATISPTSGSTAGGTDITITVSNSFASLLEDGSMLFFFKLDYYFC